MLAKLILLFIGIPLIELSLFLTIGNRIGPGATIAIVILTGILGAYLTRQQGLRTLQRYRESMNAGKLPHEEVVEGLMILIAGGVLLTPGFLTDAIGFSLLIPPVRSALRGVLGEALKGKINVVGAETGMPGAGSPPRTNRQVEGDVIEVEAEVENVRENA